MKGQMCRIFPPNLNVKQAAKRLQDRQTLNDGKRIVFVICLMKCKSTTLLNI